MPTSERENIMTEFRAASKAVISNAKCLTEGVDVPAVDMVAFLTPKRSRVDIVQATGRAMRNLTTSALASEKLDVLVNAAASFSATIQQQLEMRQSDTSPGRACRKDV